MSEQTGQSAGTGNTGSQGGDASGGNGDGGQTFVSSLPQDIQGHEQIASFDSAEGLARGYLELHGKHTELSGKVPVVPETPAAYEFSYPDGFTPNEQAMSQIREQAHKLGMTQEQAQAYVTSRINAQVAKQQADKRAYEKAAGELKAEWGDDFEANTQAAQRALENLASEEVRAEINRLGLGKNPMFVRFFHNLSTVLSEDQFTRASRSAGPKPEVGPDGKRILSYSS
jgi:hypothetical protein